MYIAKRNYFDLTDEEYELLEQMLDCMFHPIGEPWLTIQYDKPINKYFIYDYEDGKVLNYKDAFEEFDYSFVNFEQMSNRELSVYNNFLNRIGIVPTYLFNDKQVEETYPMRWR